MILNLLPYGLIIICLLLLILYQLFIEYDSPLGIVFIVLLLSAIFLRFSLNKIIPNHLYVQDTFAKSALIVGLFTIFSVFVISRGRKKNKKKNTFLLFTLYLTAGIIQQLLFQYVFLETIYYLTSNLLLTIIISVIYYSLFHLREGAAFYLKITIMGTFWALIYLNFGNIIPLIISHGIVGTVYYTSDVISDRCRLYRNTRLNK